ncbi:MAG: hypothetical protein FJW31_17125 [Acidobacteria bacterium]|nr:hypothetical protein [Acidobacteriota bacterium]
MSKKIGSPISSALAYLNPSVNDGAAGANRYLWLAMHVFVDGKMRAICSLLFGAGALLFLERAAARTGTSAAPPYYRRTLLLVAFGVLHGHLLWWGDILYTYDIASLFLYPVRHWTARKLAVAGAFCLLLNSLVYPAGNFKFTVVSSAIKEFEQIEGTRSLAPKEQQKLARL